MASSVTMAASFLATPSLSQTQAQPRRLIISNSNSVKASSHVNVKISCENKQEDLINNNNNNNNGRREMLFAVAAAALCSSVTAAAFAEEPKRGTPQAKKAYAPVCVANPTAKICNY